MNSSENDVCVNGKRPLAISLCAVPLFCGSVVISCMILCGKQYIDWRGSV